MGVSMRLEAADEKTVALNLEEGETIAEVSPRARKTDMIRHLLQYHSAFLEVKR